MKIKSFTKKAICVALLGGGALVAGSSQATTTNLGPASVGVPLTFAGYATPGTYTDTFTFTLPANGGSGYTATNFTLIPGMFNTMLTTMSLFSDSDGTPFNSVSGEALVGSSVAPGGNSLNLVVGASPAGFYYLTVGGVANGTSGGIYNGAISVAAVPEPESYAMFLAGLGLMGVIVRRRMRGQS